MEPQRRILRHFLAAIAYRAQKALRGAPHDFGDFRAAPGVRTPHQLVRHMSDVLGYARTRLAGGEWRARRLPTFEQEVTRFHEILADLSHHIATGAFVDTTPERLLQGPLADAMSHAGQLAMLRRLAGSPIPPENFIEAEIQTDNVGPDQRAPVSPDAEWYPAEEEPF